MRQQKYEFKLVVIENSQKCEDLLNELGDQGFYVAGFAPEAESVGEVSVTRSTLVMQREKPWSHNVDTSDEASGD